MPLYRFIIYNSQCIDDPDGTELPDDDAARQEALQIIRELKKSDDLACWKSWTIEVTEGDRRVWQISFATVEG